MTPLAGPAASAVSGGRLLDMPFSKGIPLLEAAAIVVAFLPTGFSSFPHLRACPPPMRVADDYRCHFYLFFVHPPSKLSISCPILSEVADVQFSA